MFRIPGIVSLIQKRKNVLSEEDVVTIGCQIWKNKDNPALLKCVCPKEDPNYVFDPYNPDVPVRVRRRYKRNTHIQHDTIRDDDCIDLEIGKTVANQYELSIKQLGSHTDSDDGSFWSDLANAVFGTDQVKIDKKHDYNTNDVEYVAPQPISEV
eukprot:850525_1